MIPQHAMQQPSSTSMDDASFLTICLTGCNKLYWKYRLIKKLVSTLFMLFLCCVGYRLAQNQRVFWSFGSILVVWWLCMHLGVLSLAIKVDFLFWSNSTNLSCVCELQPVPIMWILVCATFFSIYFIYHSSMVSSVPFSHVIETFELFIRIWQFSSNICIFICNWDPLVV